MKKEHSINGMDTQITHFSELPGMHYLLADISEKMQQCSPLVIAVAGRSGSGKTGVVSSEIQRQFPGKVLVHSLDDYSKGNSFVVTTNQAGGNINWDHPEYLDLELFSLHLKALKNNQSIEKPLFNFQTGERESETACVLPQPLIVVEGIYSHHPIVRQNVDIAVFVQASAEVALARRIHRDLQRTSMSEEAIASYVIDVAEPMFKKYVEAYKASADHIIVNEYDPSTELAPPLSQALLLLLSREL